LNKGCSAVKKCTKTLVLLRSYEQMTAFINKNRVYSPIHVDITDFYTIFVLNKTLLLTKKSIK